MQWRPRHSIAATIALYLSSSTPVLATSTPAATSINNTASLVYQQGGANHEASSNTAALLVAEELGIELSWGDTAALELGAGARVTVPVTLANRGNGREAFVLDGAVQGADATLDGFAEASAGSNPADPQIATGGHTVVLAPGQTLRLVAFVTGHGTGRGTLTVSAHALTGFGTPGTVFPGQGDGGGDAVVGPTTAAAALSRPVSLVAAGDASGPAVVLDKQQAITAPDGSANPVHGALIRYTLAAHVTGQGSATGAVVADPTPDGTDYMPGSLTLDGTALADAGNTDAAGIAVPLGDLAAGTTRTITFQVKIR